MRFIAKVILQEWIFLIYDCIHNINSYKIILSSRWLQLCIRVSVRWNEWWRYQDMQLLKWNIKITFLLLPLKLCLQEIVCFKRRQHRGGDEEERIFYLFELWKLFNRYFFCNFTLSSLYGIIPIFVHARQYCCRLHILFILSVLCSFLCLITFDILWSKYYLTFWGQSIWVL